MRDLIWKVVVTTCHRVKDCLTYMVGAKDLCSVAPLHDWFSGRTLLARILFHCHMVFSTCLWGIKTQTLLFQEHHTNRSEFRLNPDAGFFYKCMTLALVYDVCLLELVGSSQLDVSHPLQHIVPGALRGAMD